MNLLHSSDGWSLGLTLVLFLGLFGWSRYLLAPNIADQLDRLSQALPESLANLESQLNHYEWGKSLTSVMDQPATFLSGKTNLLGKATGIVSITLSWITNFIVIFFLGVYLASEPDTYLRGVVKLFPVYRRKRMRDVLMQTGETLQRWLLGKLASMTVIGILTAIGLWILGIPLAPILAIIAAMLTFIPNLGPILSAFPAVLLGLMRSPTQALLVIALYLGIQILESYLVTPLIQRRTISIPPALTLTAQILLGMLFGILGIALATPLAAATMTLIQKLYFEDALESNAALSENSSVQ